MSIYSCIEIKLNKPFSPSELLSRLVENGWWVDLDGSASFMFGGQDDWTIVKSIDLDHLSNWFSMVENRKLSFRCIFVHRETGVGGIFSSDHDWKNIAWIIDINRPSTSFSDYLTDYTMCLDLIWPAIEGMRESISSLSCSQY